MLVYGVVARASDKVVLAQHATHEIGNLEEVALECFQSFSHDEEPRFTIMCDGWSFNFVVDSGYFVGVAADEACGRELPFACARRICDAFVERLAEKGRTARAHSLQRVFRPVIKHELEYCQVYADEVLRGAAVRAKVDEVKGILIGNLEWLDTALQSPPTKLDATYAPYTPSTQADPAGVRDRAAVFQQTGDELRARMKQQSLGLKFWLTLFAALIVLGVGMVIVCSNGERCRNDNTYSGDFDSGDTSD